MMLFVDLNCLKTGLNHLQSCDAIHIILELPGISALQPLRKRLVHITFWTLDDGLRSVIGQLGMEHLKTLQLGDLGDQGTHGNPG